MARLSEWCTKFGYQVVPAKETSDAVLWTVGTTMFVLKDMFTTLNGLWDLSNQGQPGAIPPWALADYNVAAFDDKGGATHLFAMLLGADGAPNKATQFGYWSDGYAKLAGWDGKGKPDWLTIQAAKPASGWANVAIEHSSGFDYAAGARGPWCVCKIPGMSDVVTGLGLPASWHISTFMVFQEVPRDAVPPVVPPADSDALTRIAVAFEKFNAWLGVK